MVTAETAVDLGGSSGGLAGPGLLALMKLRNSGAFVWTLYYFMYDKKKKKIEKF